MQIRIIIIYSTLDWYEEYGGPWSLQWKIFTRICINMQKFQWGFFIIQSLFGGCFENIVARRCLKYSETDDVVVFPSVECIIEAQNNASRVIGELLGIEITKVKWLKGLYSKMFYLFSGWIFEDDFSQQFFSILGCIY